MRGEQQKRKKQKIEEEEEEEEEEQQHLKSFDVVWAHFGKGKAKRFWPGTFFESDWLSELSAPHHVSDKHVAVKFFGTYDHCFFSPADMADGAIVKYEAMPSRQISSKEFRIAAAEAHILHAESRTDRHIVPLFWTFVRNPDLCACCGKAASKDIKCTECQNPWHSMCLTQPHASPFVCPDCDGRQSRRAQVHKQLQRLRPLEKKKQRQRGKGEQEEEEEEQEEQEQELYDQGGGHEDEQEQQKLRWSERQLMSGNATGAISFPSLTLKGRLNVCYSEGRGRGLFAATNFRKGDVITSTPVAAAARESATALDYLQV